jgi:Peptidase M15
VPHKLALLVVAASFLSACSSRDENHDSARYARWQQSGTHNAQAVALQSYLTQHGVGKVLPLRQLLRSDTQWWMCGAEPFAVPPKDQWPHIISTLKVIRDDVQPLMGPVEALSVFRGPAINRCIKGASQSTHLRFHAIDMRPTRPFTRAQLILKLCTLHAEKGKVLNMGLGIYRGNRFHIDTAGYRRWGQDHHSASSPCTRFVALQRKIG